MTARLSFATLHMPPWSLQDTIAAGHLLGVDANMIQDNFEYMPDIARYMFTQNAAKEHVQHSIDVVNPTQISNMVATQHTDKDVEKSMVHSLVQWKNLEEDGKIDFRSKVHFELVSRYAETLVAQKLFTSESAELNRTRHSLSAVSGAESYAKVLFEAYAIREFLHGGQFNV